MFSITTLLTRNLLSSVAGIALRTSRVVRVRAGVMKRVTERRDYSFEEACLAAVTKLFVIAVSAFSTWATPTTIGGGSGTRLRIFTRGPAIAATFSLSTAMPRPASTDASRPVICSRF